MEWPGMTSSAIRYAIWLMFKAFFNGASCMDGFGLLQASDWSIGAEFSILNE